MHHNNIYSMKNPELYFNIVAYAMTAELMFLSQIFAVVNFLNKGWEQNQYFQIFIKFELWHISADSSNELSDLHTTQSLASDVRWGARFSGHWVITSMFA